MSTSIQHFDSPNLASQSWTTLTSVAFAVFSVSFRIRRPIQLWRRTQITMGMATTSATDTTKAPSGRKMLRIWPTELTSTRRRRRGGNTSSKRKLLQVLWAEAF